MLNPPAPNGNVFCRLAQEIGWYKLRLNLWLEKLKFLKC